MRSSQVIIFFGIILVALEFIIAFYAFSHLALIEDKNVRACISNFISIACVHMMILNLYPLYKALK